MTYKKPTTKGGTTGTAEGSEGEIEQLIERRIMCELTARNIERLINESEFEFITDLLVDAIGQTSRRLGIAEPTAWFEAPPGKRVKEIKALAQWLRNVPLGFSLRQPHRTE
jgi:hypothetical protein